MDELQGIQFVYPDFGQKNSQKKFWFSDKAREDLSPLLA
jgi:hypothetical protein